MAEHLYEGAMTKTTGAAAAPFAEVISPAVAAGKRPMEIREIGIFNVSGVAAEVGIGRPAAIGITPATLTTVQALDAFDVIAGNTTIAATWGTAPTAPATFMRRAQLQAVAGAGVIFTWLPGEFVMWSASAIGTIVLWQISALAVTYDLYVKCAELPGVSAWVSYKRSRVVGGNAPQAPDYLAAVADMQPASGANVPPQIVSAQVRALSPSPGYVLIPGDITNDGTNSSPAEYTIFDGYYGVMNVQPVPGNHDHAPNGDPANTPTNLVDYDAYFGTRGHSANTPPHFYSFDTPAGWHIIGLDSGTQWIGSVANPSATYTALAADLAANTGKPTLAFWHHPRWSDGTNTADPGGTGDCTEVGDLWNLLYDNHADLVLNGHCHSYQRFPKLGKTGSADSAGIREFVTGTGGSGLHTLTGAGRADVNSYQAAAYDQVNSKWFGYFELWLYPHPHAYSWRFTSQNAVGSESPGSVLDSGGPVASNQP